jgi:hypothetical protein
MVVNNPSDKARADILVYSSEPLKEADAPSESGSVRRGSRSAGFLIDLAGHVANRRTHLLSLIPNLHPRKLRVFQRVPIF